MKFLTPNIFTKIIRTFLVGILLLGVGCSGKYTSHVTLAPNRSLRVAVLPFLHKDGEEIVTPAQSNLLIDQVSFVSSTLQQTPAQYVQQFVQGELTKTSLDVVSPAFVAAQLSHNGFADESGAVFDIEKLYKNDPVALCNLLACDALLYGTLTKWDRSYYAIQSVSTVGINLRMVSPSDGVVLFEATAEDSASRGISKGPTGFSDLVIEPIKGLSNEIITQLAQDTVQTMLAPLRLENRPEYLNAAPPAIYGAAHDGSFPTLDRAKPLLILMHGSPNDTAFFSIGDKILYQPMVEREKGHYVSRFYPLASDRFENEPLYVWLIDQFGKTSKQQVGTTPLTLR
jgi:hypothetical protein